MRGILLTIVAAALSTAASGQGITPIVHRPLVHEEKLFDWHPKFSVNVPAFDNNNRVWLRTRTGQTHLVDIAAQTLTRDGWTSYSITGAVRQRYPDYAYSYYGGGSSKSRIVFDGDNDAYTLLDLRMKDERAQNVLMHSADGCRTWEIIELPEGRFTMEHFTGHNLIERPPAVVIFRPNGEHPAPWARPSEMLVFLPRKVEGRIELGEPVSVTAECVGYAEQSGGASARAPLGGKPPRGWGGIAGAGATGGPAYATTIDRRTRAVAPKVMLAHGAPVNDIHNMPGIALDSEGFLHVVTGSHGANFYYLKSLQPNSTQAGWSEPVPTLTKGWIERKTGEERGRQTYVSMVVDPEDTVHIAFRQWRQGVDAEWFPESYVGALSYQRKPKNGNWSEARPLVIPPGPGYALWFNQMAIDRRGKIFLSYNYNNHDPRALEPYKNLDGIHHFRSLLVSADRGDSWEMAEDEDFEVGD